MVTETDVTLAKASNAVIIAFNVKPSKESKKRADQEKISIFSFKSTVGANLTACREPGGKIYENKCYFLAENFKGSQCECEKYCEDKGHGTLACCLLYTSPSPRD